MLPGHQGGCSAQVIGYDDTVERLRIEAHEQGYCIPLTAAGVEQYREANQMIFKVRLKFKRCAKRKFVPP